MHAVDDAALEAIRRRRSAQGNEAPRIGVFLFDWNDADALRQTLDRFPDPVLDWLDEIVVVLDDPHQAPPDAESLTGPRKMELRFHRRPRNDGFGGARKSAFEYALRRGFDQVVVMRGDGLHPPEALPELLAPAHEAGDAMLLASRFVHRAETRRAGMPALRVAAHWLSTGFQNRLLGLRLHDYHSSFRVVPRRVLESVPFQLATDDRRFDMEFLIQCRALGAPVEEVPVLPAWREYDGDAAGLRHVLGGCRTAVDYRLHQLHLTRNGRYLVDEGIHYTLKQSETGSHMQIVNAIRPGSRVLDLGCSQGLLSRPLREKQVQLTGVDSGPADARLSPDLEAYYQRDLELPLEIPTGRDFDYVVCADVIEHLRERLQLLRSARRYLKEGGRLIISTGNVALWFYRLSLLLGRFEYGPRGVLDETHVHLYTGSTFRREVEKAGFHVLEQRVTALPFEVVFESTGRSRLVRALANSYHALARVWPSMFAYQFILEAEITTLDEEATAP